MVSFWLFSYPLDAQIVEQTTCKRDMRLFGKGRVCHCSFSEQRTHLRVQTILLNEELNNQQRQSKREWQFCDKRNNISGYASSLSPLPTPVHQLVHTQDSQRDMIIELASHDDVGSLIQSHQHDHQQQRVDDVEPRVSRPRSQHRRHEVPRKQPHQSDHPRDSALRQRRLAENALAHR